VIAIRVHDVIMKRDGTALCPVTGESGPVLARFFMTHTYEQLYDDTLSALGFTPHLALAGAHHLNNQLTTLMGRKAMDEHTGCMKRLPSCKARE
jgi:hypothetical protein